MLHRKIIMAEIKSQKYSSIGPNIFSRKIPTRLSVFLPVCLSAYLSVSLSQVSVAEFDALIFSRSHDLTRKKKACTSWPDEIFGTFLKES